MLTILPLMLWVQPWILFWILWRRTPKLLSGSVTTISNLMLINVIFLFHIINVEDEIIECSSSVKPLGVTIDNKLNFDEHVSKLCKKASQKIHALARISNFVSQDKLCIIMSAFIESQFGYCPLAWMLHSRTLNNRINRLHERALRLVYKDHQLTFGELLRKDN